jgi:hypothetical protein
VERIITDEGDTLPVTRAQSGNPVLQQTFRGQVYFV